MGWEVQAEGEEEVKYVKVGSSSRRIAYREVGCSQETATKSLLAFHGMMASRLCAVPGIREETLKEFGARLICIDRPGYGRSDPDIWQSLYSATQEIEEVIDKLGMGKKVWLMGLSMGAAFCWAAARYIPHRVAGIAMWSPVGSLSWKGISIHNRLAMVKSYGLGEQIFSYIAKLFPFIAFELYAKHLSYDLSKGPSKDITKWLSEEDWKCLYRPGVEEKMTKDYVESLQYFKGFGVAKDLQLLFKGWGFELSEIAGCYKGKVHIWQGQKDRLVPPRLQQWVQKMLPGIVVLHELPDEGHISWICYNDAAHRETLKTLFAE